MGASENGAAEHQRVAAGDALPASVVSKHAVMWACYQLALASKMTGREGGFDPDPDDDPEAPSR